MIEALQDPELFLSRFAEIPGVPLALGPAQFMRLPANERSQLSFLDTSELRKPIELELSLAEFIAQAGLVPASHSFGMIYHSAFCCSTYLARCLEAVGVGAALKEPYALTQLAFYQADESWQQFASAAEWDKLLATSVEFLIRQQADGAFSLVKLHNFGIILATSIARQFADRVRSVFIYSDLQPFLVSVLKSPARREFVRLLLKFVSPQKAQMLDIPILDPASLDDGAAAAYCWLLHMAYHRLAARQLEAYELCAVDCDRLLEQPAATLAALAQFWGRALTADEIQARLQDPALQTHAKEPARKFSARQRLTDLQTHGFRYRKEISRARAWFDALDLPAELRAEPANPLQLAG